MKAVKIRDRAIDEHTIYFTNGKRKTKSKVFVPEKNPERMLIDRFGDLELFTYPYSSGDRVGIGLGRKYITINLNDLIRFFWRNASLLRRIRRYNQNGVRNKKGSASKWWDCYLAGMAATNRRTQGVISRTYGTTKHKSHEELLREEYITSRTEKKAYKCKR